MKVVIIGQSPAVVAAIKKLREDDNSEAVEITLISADGHLPYERALFPELISRKVREKELFCEPEDFYRKNNIELVLDRSISRVNFNRRRIFLSAPAGEAQGGRTHIDYDILIMADTPVARLPELKGIRRTGVFHLGRLDSVHKLVRYLPLIETAVVVPTGLPGIAAALALKDTGKDVILLSPGEKLLEGCLEPRLSALLAGLLKQRGLRLFLNNVPEDVLGDVDMKAVRCSSGKILAAEMMILENVVPDLRSLNDTGLVVAERVPVMATMQTNLPNVFAIDAVMEMESPGMTGGYGTSTHIGILQGETAAMAVRGLAASFTLEPEDLRARVEALFTSEEVRACEQALDELLSSGSFLSEEKAQESVPVAVEGE